MIQKTIPKEIKATDKSKLQGKELEYILDMTRGFEKLKEVWLIWNGDIIKIKK